VVKFRFRWYSNLRRWCLLGWLYFFWCWEL